MPLSLCVHCIILLFVFEIQYACQWIKIRFIFLNLCVCVFGFVSVLFFFFLALFFRTRSTKTCHVFLGKEINFIRLTFTKKSGWDRFQGKPSMLTYVHANFQQDEQQQQPKEDEG